MTRARSSRLIARAALALAIALPTTLSGQSRNSWTPGNYLTQAISTVYAAAAAAIAIEDELGFDGGASLFGSLVRRGGSTSILQTFNRGEEYVVIGGGDNDAQDVDVTILDSLGRSVASDRLTDATPVVHFRPTRSGRYTVRVSLYRATDNAFVALAILRKGGWQVGPDRMVAAARTLVSSGSFLATKGSSGFLAEENQWAVWGGVAPSREIIELTGVTLGQGKRIVIAATDDEASDIDLYVRSSAGTLLASDEGSGADAVVSLESAAGRRYNLTAKNAGNGTNFVMTGVLTLRQQ